MQQIITIPIMIKYKEVVHAANIYNEVDNIKIHEVRYAINVNIYLRGK